MKNYRIIIAIITTLIITSCSSEDEKFEKLGRKDNDIELKYPVNNKDKRRAERGRILLGGASILGGGADTDTPRDVKGGVNAYLWQASLEVLSFMPLTSADAVGGVIVTDWYEDSASKGEKIKANVFINSQDLRASGVSVKLFRQVYSGGRWVNAKTNKETETKLEDKILTRARELRLRGDV